VKLLAASNGAEAKSYSLGKTVMDAEISVDALKIGAGNTKGDLSDQIKEAVTLPLNELATAQIYLVQQLANNPDEDATKVLLQVADTEKTANALKDEARKSIAARKNGAAAMEEMRARHANFLKDTRTPPVGPMATALAAMKETKAAGLLLDQLLDPALPNRDLLDTAQGVSALAGKEQMPGLQKFVQLYRGSSTGNLSLTDALGAVGAAILRVGGADGKTFVVNIQKDALTDKDVKETLQKQLDAAEPKKVETKEPPKVDDDKGKKKKKKVEDEDEPVPAAVKAKLEKEKAEKAKKDKEKKDKEKADGGSTESNAPTPAPSGSAAPAPSASTK